MEPKYWLSYLFGFLIVSTSIGAGLVNSFEGNFLPTFLGVTGFILGYKISQLSLEEKISYTELQKRLKNLGLSLSPLVFLMGSGIMAYGFMKITRSISDAEPLTGGFGSLIVFIGYLLAHHATNKVLI